MSKLWNIETQITNSNIYLCTVLNSLPICNSHWQIPYSFGICKISESLSISMFHFQEVPSYRFSEHLLPLLAGPISFMKSCQKNPCVLYYCIFHATKTSTTWEIFLCLAANQKWSLIHFDFISTSFLILRHSRSSNLFRLSYKLEGQL